MAIDMETRIERALRRRWWVVPTATLLAALALYAALGVLAGLVAHAFMVVVVHDAAHGAITRGPADRWLCSVGAGALLLPLYGEAFRKYHLLHHRHTNERRDPLFSPKKERLFARSRLSYMALDLVPMLLTFVCPADAVPKAGIRRRCVVAAIGASLVVIVTARPELPFVVLSIASLYAWATLRDWCEHFGVQRDGFANTYAFPLGMGIGNHAAHHRHPSYSWLTMTVGLRLRPKDTNLLGAAWSMATDRRVHHYRAPRRPRRPRRSRRRSTGPRDPRG